MNLNSVACNKYERLINDEVANAEFHLDHVLIKGLKDKFITVEGKKLMGLPENINFSMYDISKASLDAMPKMRFIYLMSLFEAFVKEYIAERSAINMDEIKNYTKTIQSEWDKTERSGTSLYNLKYVNFLFDRLYGIIINNGLNDSQVTVEAGILRNCIVHHNGEITNQFFFDELIHTIDLFKLEKIGDTIVIDKKLMGIYIEDIRSMLKICDY